MLVKVQKCCTEAQHYLTNNEPQKALKLTEQAMRLDPWFLDVRRAMFVVSLIFLVQAHIMHVRALEANGEHVKALKACLEGLSYIPHAHELIEVLILDVMN